MEALVQYVYNKDQAEFKIELTFLFFTEFYKIETASEEIRKK